MSLDVKLIDYFNKNNIRFDFRSNKPFSVFVQNTNIYEIDDNMFTFYDYAIKLQDIFHLDYSEVKYMFIDTDIEEEYRVTDIVLPNGQTFELDDKDLYQYRDRKERLEIWYSIQDDIVFFTYPDVDEENFRWFITTYDDFKKWK